MKGKIVLCNQSAGDIAAYRAGALGSISINDRSEDYSNVEPLPALVLSIKDYDFIMSYMKSIKCEFL